MSDDLLVFRALKGDELARLVSQQLPIGAIPNQSHQGAIGILVTVCYGTERYKIQSKTASYACRKLDMERAPARKKLVMTEADEPSLPLELAWVPYSTKPTLGLLARV